MLFLKIYILNTSIYINKVVIYIFNEDKQKIVIYVPLLLLFRTLRISADTESENNAHLLVLSPAIVVNTFSISLACYKHFRGARNVYV